MGDTASTERTVSRYFHAWTGRDSATVREVLAAGLGMHLEGRDAFLDAGAFFAGRADHAGRPGMPGLGSRSPRTGLTGGEHQP